MNWKILSRINECIQILFEREQIPFSPKISPFHLTWKSNLFKSNETSFALQTSDPKSLFQGSMCNIIVTFAFVRQNLAQMEPADRVDYYGIYFGTACPTFPSPSAQGRINLVERATRDSLSLGARHGKFHFDGQNSRVTIMHSCIIHETWRGIPPSEIFPSPFLNLFKTLIPLPI